PPPSSPHSPLFLPRRMESDNHPYLNWLFEYNEAHLGFTNSYYFVQFCENITSICQEGEEMIPLIAIVKDLQMEEQDGNESKNIRQLVIHLLKLVSLTPNQIDSSNYNDHLRQIMDDILNQERNPLTYCPYFCSLDTEVKLYILFLLQQKSQRTVKYPKLIVTDSEDNQYFLVNGGRLHVEYGKKLNDLAKRQSSRGKRIEGKRLSVEDELNELRPMKLLAETREQWAEVARIIRNFGENETSLRITEKMEEALLMMMVLEHDWLRQSSVLQSEEKLNRMIEEEIKQFTQPKSILKTELTPIKIKAKPRFAQENIDASEKKDMQARRRPVKYLNKHLRCHFFPDCPLSNDECDFSHQEKLCDTFPDCRGRDCPYQHMKCTVDRYCVDEFCIYAHFEQKHPRLESRCERL
ncbi:hypothetical protein PENTCL1PPCAC_2121, partial [Pristionchus entomophagus]